ncbi:MAG: class I SAM-dependent RNA methyltransferase [Gemmatimonadota bacterium]|nr:MAG: class I SAM-dependent RNA methyltransferase [Gemmatimonadota bacterium]
MIQTVTIGGIAAGGDGVGRLSDGMAVFVPRTAPGDEAEIEVTERKGRFARARLVRLAGSGPDRVDPPCPHYEGDRCGGCRLQHMSVSAQREVKGRLVGDALRRIGKREVSDPSVVPSSEQWRYRSKITLAVADGRIGLHREDSPGSVFELDDCLLVRERVMRLWGKMREQRRFLPVKLESLVLREDRDGRLHAMVAGGDESWDAGELAVRLGDEEISFWWRPEKGAARVVAGPTTGFPAVAFEQVNAELAQEVRLEAVRGVGDVAGKVVWDLYGGVGDTAELLRARGAEVWSIDSDRTAVEWGRARGSSEVKRLVGRVEESLGRMPIPAAIVVNPPRAGVDSGVARFVENWAGVARAGVQRLAYVSCDPATLARDLGRMPSLHIRSVTAFDLFPHTAHVETLALLEAR